MRQGIKKDLIERSVVHPEAEEQKHQGREKKDDARKTEQPEQTGVHVADALGEIQPLPAQDVFEQQNLGHALRPAAALQDEVFEGFRGQTHAHRLVEVDAVVSFAVKYERGFGVLGDRVAGHALDVHQGFAAQKRAEPQKKDEFHRSRPSCTTP